MIIRRALSGVKKKIRPRRRAILVLGLGRVRAAGLGAKTFYRVTSVAQLAALQRPKPASRNTHQTKSHSHWRWRRYRPWPLRSLRRSAHAYRVPGGYWHSALPGRRTPPDCQLPNDVPYRHPNETADACFFFIF